MKKQVMTTAWNFFKNNIYATFSEALKAAWKRIKLVAALKSGIAYFSFTKKDGSIREAIGTLNPTNFTYTAKGTAKKINLTIVKYWDIEKRAYRSLKIENLLSIG